MGISLKKSTQRTFSEAIAKKPKIKKSPSVVYPTNKDQRQLLNNLKKSLAVVRKRQRAIVARDLVQYFRSSIILRAEEGDMKPFFYRGFNDREFKAAISMVVNGSITLEEWKQAIEWFMSDQYWGDKISSLWGVQKHFMKYQMATKKKLKKGREWLMSTKDSSEHGVSENPM